MRKPKLSFWQIWNMSFGFLGIQFGFGLQNANMSRIFQTLGADMEGLAILWLAAPITGLLAQPLIGYYSDRTWGKLGRRRPYFLIGAILASIALFIMPNSPVLWVSAGMLWILDASINISMEPFRAFVGDNLPSEQRTAGFAMQTFFIGVGAVVASAFPYLLTELGVSNTAPEGVIPDTVKWSFYFGGAAFLITVLWTVFSSKEYSPEEMEAFEDVQESESYVPQLTSDGEYLENGRRQRFIGFIAILATIGFGFLVYSQSFDKSLYALVGLIGLMGVLMAASGSMQLSGSRDNVLVNIINDFQFMPKTMKQLAGVQFFSWFGLFAMWIYTTGAVTSYVWGTTDTTSAAYAEGADWVGIMFAVYNGVAALVAFLLPIIAKKTSRKITHLICLFLGGIGLISIFFITDKNMLLASMIGVGFAWGSILSMPYAILTGSLPGSKMGYYMGVFNFFIVIPQIVAASILGFILGQFFDKDPIYAMIIGGVSMIIAGILTMQVEDKDDF